MKITKQSFRYKTVSRRAISMEELIEMVKSDDTEQKVKHFRSALPKILLKRHINAERILPRLLFAGTFRKETLKEYNGWILLSVSNLSSLADAWKMRQKISEYPQTLFAMTGADEHSVKFVIPYTLPDGSLPKEREKIELFHKYAYNHAVEVYEPRLNFSIDLEEGSLETSCHLSYDPNVYYNPYALAIHIEQPTEMPKEISHREKYMKLPPNISSTKEQYEKFRYVSIQYEAAYKKACEQYGYVDKNADFKMFLTCLGKLCFGGGVEEEDCVRWTNMRLFPLVSVLEIRETMANVYRTEKGFDEKPVINKEQLQALKEDEFMQRRYSFRYNVMTDAPEYKENTTLVFDFRPITQRVMHSIALDAHHEGLSIWDRDVDRYIKSDRVKNYYPIEDYLDSLPSWDRKEHIRELAGRVPCTNANWEELFYKWFLSMVAHWMGIDKQHSNSISPLLVGGQGCGKSTFCRMLIPKELEMYYTDSIDFSKRRDAELYLTRFALINIDEFDQVSERYQGFLKHLLQKPVVNIRKPYAAQVEAVRRYASFIGTSNHSDLLNDISGSRRFICVEVTGMIDTYQPIEYKQLYAQAVAAIKRGERYWLTHEEEEDLMEKNENFRKRLPFEDLFYKYYRPASNPDEGVKMSAGEIFTALGKKNGHRLPDTHLGHFGRFLKKIVTHKKTSNRGVLYLVVEK